MAKSKSPLPTKSRVERLQVSFPDAMRMVIDRKKVRRIEWPSEDEYGLLKDSFLMIHRNGAFHIWQVSEGDMSAIDWVVLD